MSEPFDRAAWEPLPLRDVVAPDGAVEAFLAWARDEGVECDAIEVRVDAHGDRSVFARRAIEIGEVLVSVPRALMITNVDIAADPVIEAMREHESLLQSKHSMMGLWWTRRAREADSPWRRYVDAVPQAFPWLPAFRPADEVAGLAETRALAAVDAQVSGTRGDHALFDSLLGDDVPSLAELAWGRMVAATRCFRVAFDDGGVRALVPIADLINHAPVADTTWAYEPARARFEVTAVRALAVGDEISTTYGSHDNALYVSGHGFALTDNHDDEVALTLRTPGGGVAWAPIGASYDARFHSLVRLARRNVGGDDEPDTVRNFIAASAASSLAALSVPVEFTGDARWLATCATVRAGERAVLTAILAFLDVMPALEAQPRDRAGWLALAAEHASGATLLDRLITSYARNAAGDDQDVTLTA